MKLATYITTGIILLFFQETKAQNVIFLPDGHYTNGGKKYIIVSTVLDAVTSESQTVFGNTYFNESYEQASIIMKLNSKLNGFVDSVLWTSPKIKPGIQSFFVGFSLDDIRGYSALMTTVTPIWKNNGAIVERVVFKRSKEMYKNFTGQLVELITQPENAAIISVLPKGLKGLICIDFVSGSAFGGEADQFYCKIDKYQFSESLNPADEDRFFKMIDGQIPSNLYAYLHTEWQAGPKQIGNNFEGFNRELAQITKDYKTYALQTTSGGGLNVAFKDIDDTFHRVLIWVNN